MILKVGTILLVSASLAILALGCQGQTDEVVKKDASKKASVTQSSPDGDSNPVTNLDESKYRNVSINVTGLT